MVERFDVFLVSLDDEVGKDAKNTRPCVVVSPDEINRNISTVIVAPLSSNAARYPTRIPVTFLNSERAVVLDQLRVVDKPRLVKKVGVLDESARKPVIECLSEMFAE
ncbi:MAG: type II toxin-antitoxin system PemK/MazF family toxin [Pyrinomonadaceae bacterium]|nr:type II toxin-antitoxin system PemK/MazF family toxin [Pyrinomonadaceae bacterium]